MFDMARRGSRLTIRLILAIFPLAALADEAPAVDYSRPDAWMALPGQPSPADATPRGGGFSNLQSLARADVFYIHPTTAVRSDVLNAPIGDPDARKTGSVILMAQATAFNAVARVFAPRYSQASLRVFDLGDTELQEPMNRAYADVRRAFAYYLEHYNRGRPFFLAGHSQGANLGLRLLIERIRNTPVERLLVAAYLPGGPVPSSMADAGPVRVAACVRPAQTGCAAIWGVFGEGYSRLEDWEKGNVYWDPRSGRWSRPPSGQPQFSINPVSWSKRESRTPAARHRGAAPFGRPATHFSRPLPGLVAARDDGRYVFVSPPLSPELFDDGGVFGGANYHVFDISLFWVDLRENARQRLIAFLRSKGAAYPLITSGAQASAAAGRPFRFRIQTDRPGAAFQADGLPEGLKLHARSGVISGSALRAGVYPVVLSASNAAGSDHAELALTVTEGGVQ